MEQKQKQMNKLPDISVKNQTENHKSLEVPQLRMIEMKQIKINIEACESETSLILKTEEDIEYELRVCEKQLDLAQRMWAVTNCRYDNETKRTPRSLLMYDFSKSQLQCSEHRLRRAKDSLSLAQNRYSITQNHRKELNDVLQRYETILLTRKYDDHETEELLKRVQKLKRILYPQDVPNFPNIIHVLKSTWSGFETIFARCASVIKRSTTRVLSDVCKHIKQSYR